MQASVIHVGSIWEVYYYNTCVIQFIHIRYIAYMMQIISQWYVIG